MKGIKADQIIIDEINDMPEINIVEHPDRELVAKELKELGEMIDLHEKLVEKSPARPYTPNRADRRAMSKQARKKKRRT